MSHTPYHWSNKRVLNYLMHVVTKQWIHQWLTFALEIANRYVHVLLYHLLLLLLILSFLSKLILLEWIGNGKIIKYSYFCYFFMKWPATKACFREKKSRGTLIEGAWEIGVQWSGDFESLSSFLAACPYFNELIYF